jgi:MerR family redox-sensitive transcriptional activator SoxR
MLKPSSSKGEKWTELTITMVARQTGFSPSTLRYYERIGLLPAARRVAGRRRYDVSTLKRLQLIAYAKKAGFNLMQIQALQERASGGEPPARLWPDLVAAKAIELDQAILRAKRAKYRLAELSQCECRSLAECGDLLGSLSECRQPAGCTTDQIMFLTRGEE